jgi:hypothetical protein
MALFANKQRKLAQETYHEQRGSATGHTLLLKGSFYGRRSRFYEKGFNENERKILAWSVFADFLGQNFTQSAVG